MSVMLEARDESNTGLPLAAYSLRSFFSQASTLLENRR
jgi:hypothetical protein